MVVEKWVAYGGFDVEVGGKCTGVDCVGRTEAGFAEVGVQESVDGTD